MLHNQEYSAGMAQRRWPLALAAGVVVLAGILLAERAGAPGSDSSPGGPADRAVMADTAASRTTLAPQPTPSSANPTPAEELLSPLVDGVFTFDGSPAAPAPGYWAQGWDLQVHSRDTASWQNLDPMHAEHGPACEAPTVTHLVTSYEDAVFLCRDHLMTALNAPGYGVIYLTPNQMVDWSTGEAVISFDISTFRSSRRDWWDVWITPYEDNLALPLPGDIPDAQGPPRRAIQVGIGSENQVCVGIYDDFAPVGESGNEYWRQTCKHWMRYPNGLEPDKARRDTFEIRIGNGRIRVGMPDHDHWWVDGELPAAVDYTSGVVQFGHHSYTPEKDSGGTPGTWHWDNVSISPSIPFTIIRADRRAVFESGETVRFSQPAPAGAHLRFSAVGVVEVSLDGGPFVAAEQPKPDGAANHASSYWHPVPEGTQTVQFRFSDRDWYSGPFHAKDFAIWAP